MSESPLAQTSSLKWRQKCSIGFNALTGIEDFPRVIGGDRANVFLAFTIIKVNRLAVFTVTLGAGSLVNHLALGRVTVDSFVVVVRLEVLHLLQEGDNGRQLTVIQVG